jgi:exodeoxyribonuclease VII small subunit
MPKREGGAAPPEDLSFESALERLEAIVARLETGELALESALAAFEEGVALTRHCAARLEDAERRIEVLAREGGELVARPFEPPASEEDAT